jgi:hypothetical protein
MVRDPNKDLFDVVIVDATGKPADCSSRLQAELLRRDLRVRIEVEAPPSDSNAAAILDANLTHARYWVILTTVHADDGREETGFVAVPAPRYPVKRPSFAPVGLKAPLEKIETGRMGDVAALAGRIAERVRAV